jgi:hypothetical protein
MIAALKLTIESGFATVNRNMRKLEFSQPIKSQQCLEWIFSLEQHQLGLLSYTCTCFGNDEHPASLPNAKPNLNSLFDLWDE